MLTASLRLNVNPALIQRKHIQCGFDVGYVKLPLIKTRQKSRAKLVIGDKNKSGVPIMYFTPISCPFFHHQINCIRLRHWKRVLKKVPEIQSAQPPEVDLAPSNEKIVSQFEQVMVIDNHGQNLGIMESKNGLKLATAAQCNLVLVFDGVPAVCKFRPYHAEIHEEEFFSDPIQKHEVKDRIKEVRVGDMISERDLQIKTTRMMSFLQTRYRVKLVLTCKNRNDFDPTVAKELLDNILSRVEDLALIETPLKFDGHTAIVVLRPILMNDNEGASEKSMDQSSSELEIGGPPSKRTKTKSSKMESTEKFLPPAQQARRHRERTGERSDGDPLYKMRSEEIEGAIE